MIRKMIALAILAAAILALPVAGHAAECNGEVTQIDTPAGATLYVDDRGADTGGVWVYLESNKIAGLQSGGTSAVLGDADFDPCYELDENGVPITPDQLIV